MLRLLPAGILNIVAQVFAFGVDKHGKRDGWYEVSSKDHMLAVWRHLSKPGVDDESGFDHRAHAVARLLMAMACEARADATRSYDGHVRAVGNVSKPRHRGDVGFDVCVIGNHEVVPGRLVKIPVNARIHANHLWYMLMLRSSSVAAGLTMHPAVIDGGYTGPLFLLLSATEETVHLRDGQRVAQAVFFQQVVPDVEMCDDLDATDRGAAGFGSTGT